MATILELLVSWRRWLDFAVVRRRDPGEQSAWLWAIRARILAFLVARYDDPPAALRAMERDEAIRARIANREHMPRLTPPPLDAPSLTEDIARIRLAGDGPPRPTPVDPPPDLAPLDAPPRGGRDLRRLLIAIHASNILNRRGLHWRWF